ncbi:MAG: MFS transporter, partial [Candidatus Eiseniibacteriota bacterium]
MRERPIHPIVFMFLILPFGVLPGYLSVTLGYQLSHAGVSVAGVAGIVSFGLLPHVWKFLWAPVVDTTLSRRTWYLVGGVGCALGLFAMGTLPATAATLPLLSAIAFAANVAVTFLCMSVESLMAYETPDDAKGRAGGWFQAGVLGGAGLGGGAALIIAQHSSISWLAGAVLAVACLACSLALVFVHGATADKHEHGLKKAFVTVVSDLWQVARSRAGFLALALCFLPIGSGAASGLFSAIASDWHASANEVALATGVLGGVLSALGCLAAGVISDRMHRQWAYALYGIAQGACCVAMALSPRTHVTYIVYTSLYTILSGFTFAGFSAFVLEAMGRGAAATKYNAYASLSNFPIYYVTRVNGWADTKWGPSGMLLTEAALACVALVVFFALSSA